MNTQTRKYHVFPIVMTLVMLAIATLACSCHPPRVGKISQEVDITLDEDLFTQAQPHFTVHNGHDFWDDLSVDVTRMELHDGYLRFLGARVMPDGSRADCSIDVSLGAENGMLTGRIIAVDIPGTKLTDHVIVEINQDMKVDLALSGLDAGAEVSFEEVEVTEDALRMKVHVTVRF